MNKGTDKMLIKRYVKSAAESVIAWRLIIKELAAIPLVWSAYFIAKFLVDDPSTADIAPLFAMLFWLPVVVSVISFAAASFKSALPTLIALLVLVSLVVAGGREAFPVSVMLANVGLIILGLIIFSVGFVIHGGNTGVYCRAHRT